jgi:hypothetical protein
VTYDTAVYGFKISRTCYSRSSEWLGIRCWIVLIAKSQNQFAGIAGSGDVFTLANGIHDISVAGYLRSASNVFDGTQGVAGAFVGAGGGEGGISSSGVAREGVGHEVLLEVRTGSGTHAQVAGVGLGVGVAVGEGGIADRSLGHGIECGVVPDAVEPACAVMAVADGVLGRAGRGGEVEGERTSERVVVTVEVALLDVAVEFLGDKAEGVGFVDVFRVIEPGAGDSAGAAKGVVGAGFL